MDFFISYNKADRTWAEWIAWVLEEAGYSTVLQAWDFVPGSNFVLEMQKATTEATRTIAVVSPDYLSAEFPQPEWAAALAQDIEGWKRALVPVIVQECKPIGLLAQLVHIKIVGLDENSAKNKLLEGVKSGRAKPATPPNFPGGPARAVSRQPHFPGAPARIWTVPHLRNPNFTGREELLKDLRDNLMSGKPAALVQAIHGLGGVGKTQIAIEYAYRHAADYEAVLWLVAEEPATLASGFANLAIKFGLATADVSNENLLAELVREWLKHNTRWLLIFDNARTEDSVIGYFPRSQSGHILITSRNRDWRRHAQTIAVNKMEKIEAIEFLLKRTGSEDNEAAAILADELGSLPLALEQAGAYIDQKTVSIADYLSLFKRSLSRVFITSSDYPKSIVATWDLSFQAVEERSPAAVQLLKLCAFMAPDNIPLNMLEAGSEYLPASLRNALSEPLDRADMLGELSHYSLVEVDEEQHTVSMHRLVQAVLRDKLPSQESQTWMAVAVQVVNSGFVYRRDDLNTWPVAANALPHALAVAALPHLQDPLFDDIVLALSHLLNEMGLYLMQRAQYTDARNHFTNTLSIVEANFGSEHSTVAVASNNLGSVLKELGELEGALNNCRRALEIAEAVHGSEHPLVSTILNNVGDILQDLDDLDGALSHFVRALAIDENIFGSEHPIVALRLNNIGTVHRQLGALDGALAYFERALAIGEAVYGPEHPFVSTILNNLGGVFKDLGDLEGARNAYERALAIGEAVYGPEHPTVATKLNNLGTLMEELEDLEGARNAYERALAIDEAVYGPEHPTVAIKLGNIGGVLMQQGKKKEARLYLEKAYRIFLHYLGPAHPKTVVTKSWLDGSYQAKVK